MHKAIELKHVGFAEATKLFLDKAREMAGSAHIADQYIMLHEDAPAEMLKILRWYCVHIMGVSCFDAVPHNTPCLCLWKDRVGRTFYKWHLYKECERSTR